MAKLYQENKKAQQMWEKVTRPETKIYIDLDRVTYLAASATEEVMVTIKHKETGEEFFKGEEPFEVDDPFAYMFDDTATITRYKKVKFRNKTEFYGRGKAIGGQLMIINAERELNALEPYAKEDFIIVQSYEPKDIKYLHKAVDGMINSILDFFGKDTFYGLLGHGDHLFRHDIESLVQYKEARKLTHRPCLLKECHKYVIDKYHCELVSEDEVDDRMTMIQYSGHQHFMKHGWYDKISVCTDKDSHGTAGLMFDWMKDKTLFVYPEPRIIPNSLGFLEKRVKDSGKSVTTKIFGLGRKFFYKQLITGDTTDTFSPTAYWANEFQGRKLIHNVDKATLKNGEIFAYNALKDCTTDKECWQAIVDIYKNWFPSTVEYVSWSGKHVKANYLAILQQVVDAAFMKRFDNDAIDVRAVLSKLGIEFEWQYDLAVKG